MTLSKRTSFLLIITICGIFGIAGCSRNSDACATQICLNGGSCSSGRCSCPPHYSGQHCDSCANGYESTDCNTLSRVKFLYSGYNVSESDNHGGTGSYTSSILVSANQVNQVFLVHVAGNNFSNSVAATCKGSAITIPLQSPDHNQGYVQGAGTISGGIISLTCQIGDSATLNLATFTSTWTR